MTWLVTGVSGLLGANAALDLGAGTVGVARRPLPAAPIRVLEGDLASAAGRAGLVAASGATAVLHAAAISTLEASERDPELAHEVNVRASADLAAQAAAAEAAFVYISTDAVFDGTRGGYTETDAPAPASEYGRTKLAGEQAVLDAHPGALVARVNFYGWSPSGRRSLAEFFHTALQSEGTVNGFEDQRVSTAYVGRLVEDIAALVAAGATGVVHVASAEPVTKFAFGRALATAFGADPERVLPVRSGDHLTIRRGSDLSLDTAKMEGLLGRPGARQQDGIDRLAGDRADGRADAVAAFRG